MAEPTQLAYRTLKGIGVFNAAPAYESLPAFAPYVIHEENSVVKRLTNYIDPKAISAAAPTPQTASSLPGQTLRSMLTHSDTINLC